MWGFMKHLNHKTCGYVPQVIIHVVFYNFDHKRWGFLKFTRCFFFWMKIEKLLIAKAMWWCILPHWWWDREPPFVPNTHTYKTHKITHENQPLAFSGLWIHLQHYSTIMCWITKMQGHIPLMPISQPLMTSPIPAAKGTLQSVWH